MASLADPSSWAGLAMKWGKNAVWADDPLTQIVTNAVIIAVLMLSSAVGFVVGVPLALASMLLLIVGLARLVLGYAAGLL